MTEKPQRLKTHNPTVGIRLEPEVKARLHRIADISKIPAGTLARRWVVMAMERYEEIEANLDQAGEDILHAAIAQGKEERRIAQEAGTLEELDIGTFKMVEDARQRGEAIREKALKESEERALDRMQEEYEAGMQPPE